MPKLRDQSAVYPSNSGDPNMAGSKATRGVPTPTAGYMTPSCEYSQNEPLWPIDKCPTNIALVMPPSGGSRRK